MAEIIGILGVGGGSFFTKKTKKQKTKKQKKQKAHTCLRRALTVEFKILKIVQVRILAQHYLACVCGHDRLQSGVIF